MICIAVEYQEDEEEVVTGINPDDNSEIKEKVPVFSGFEVQVYCGDKKDQSLIGGLEPIGSSIVK